MLNILDWEWCEFVSAPCEVDLGDRTSVGRQLVMVICPGCRALVLAGADQQIHADWHSAAFPDHRRGIS